MRGIRTGCNGCGRRGDSGIESRLAAHTAEAPPSEGRTELFSLFDRNDVESVHLDISAENYTARSPAPFRAWLSNSMRILQGARPALLERHLIDQKTIDAVLSAMQARIERPEGVALFHWDRVTAWKKGGRTD